VRAPPAAPRCSVPRWLIARCAAGKHKEARALFESWREGNAMDEDGARCGRQRRAQAALTLAARAGVTALQFLPDVYSYQYYLSTLVSEKGSDKGSANGSLESLDAVLAEMKARGITPKQATFNPFAWLAFNLTDWNMGKVRQPWLCAPHAPHLTPERARSGCTRPSWSMAWCRATSRIAISSAWRWRQTTCARLATCLPALSPPTS